MTTESPLRPLAAAALIAGWACIIALGADFSILVSAFGAVGLLVTVALWLKR